MEEDVMKNVIKKYVKVREKNGLEITIGMDAEIIIQVNGKQNKLKRGVLKRKEDDERKKNEESVQKKKEGVQKKPQEEDKHTKIGLIHDVEVIVALTDVLLDANGHLGGGKDVMGEVAGVVHNTIFFCI
jgi:hypothetical protein